MNTLDTTVRIDLSTAQALRRLAEKARKEGVKLFHNRDDGRWFASSVSRPGAIHYVTGYSCDCRGFARHQRCKHYAALLSALGWLEGSEPSDPEPKPTITIEHVEGHYTHGQWIPGAMYRESVWNAPVTMILVDGEAQVKVTGEQGSITVLLISTGHLPTDATSITPDGLDHAGAVEFWIGQVGGDDATPFLQDAGLFPDREFEDSLMVAA